MLTLLVSTGDLKFAEVHWYKSLTPIDFDLILKNKMATISMFFKILSTFASLVQNMAQKGPFSNLQDVLVVANAFKLEDFDKIFDGNF